ncbi:MAG: chlorophyllide reductase subunit Y, partial [Bosea sp. 12-68-7]
AIHPFYTASIREFEAAGRSIVGSGPVGVEGTVAWLSAIGEACGVGKPLVEAAQNRLVPAIRGALSAMPITGRITLSGYEGSELLVARLLVESGADLRYVGTACPRTPWSEPDREWLAARGVMVNFRATLEQDLAAMAEFQPDLAIGTTPVVQKAKQLGIPSLYFTNLISARPLFGPAGAGSLAQVVNAAIGNKGRMNAMKAFFAGVGEGDTAGTWQDTPQLHPDFREKFARRAAKAKAAAEEIP